MEYSAALSIATESVDALFCCLTPEVDAMQTKRSTVSMKREKNTLLLTVTAQDPTALRATLHGITRLLIVFEKGQKNDECSGKN